MIRRVYPAIVARPGYSFALACVLALQVWLIATHSYFVDEWQAVQIAVQSPDWPSLLESLRYEGHPPLWYAMLRLLAEIFGPHRALAAASVICAFTTILIIGTQAPLAPWQRIALVLGEPLLFEYGTVSRGYSLCVALAFLAMALWRRKRIVWLPLALLPLTEFLGGLMAVGLVVLRWREFGAREQWRIGIAMFGAASLFAAWSVIPASDFVSVYNKVGPAENLARWLRQMSAVTLPFQWNGRPTWDEPWISPLTIPLGLMYFVIAADQTRTRQHERAVALGAPLVLLVFMLLLHTLAIRHLMLAGIMFVLVMWRQAARGDHIRPLARGWLLAGAACGLATAFVALTRPFDTAPAAARIVLSKGLAGETWLSFPPQHAQGVAALTGIRFEGLGHGCVEDFIRWNRAPRITSPAQLAAAIEAESSAGGRFFLLSGYPLPPGTSGRTLARIAPGFNDKPYFLIEVPGRVAGRRAAAAPCVARLRPFPPLLR